MDQQSGIEKQLGLQELELQPNTVETTPQQVLDTPSNTTTDGIEKGDFLPQSGQIYFRKPSDATIDLLKGYIGSSILALPYSFTQAGYLLSIIVFTLIGYSIYHIMKLLLEIADNTPKKDIGYPMLASLILGKKGNFLLKLFLVLFQIGCCISYIIFFIEFFEHAFNTAGNTADDLIYLALAFCLIVPISFLNNIQMFHKISNIANAIMISSILAIMIFELNIMSKNKDTVQRSQQDVINFNRVPLMIGVSIYSFEAIGNVFSVRNKMQNQQDFKEVFKFTNVIVICGYVIFSLFGMLALGNNMNEIILFSLPGDNLLVALLQVSYALALVMSYPLQLLPSFQIVEKTKIIKNFIKEGSDGARKKRICIRVFILILICMCAFSIPRFAIFINIVGSLCGTFLQFIFPVVMYQKVFGDKITSKFRMRNYFLMAIGILGGSYAFIYSLLDLILKNDDV